MEIIEGITLEQVIRAKPAMIYYAVHTCWWTHDPAHVRTRGKEKLPCCPRGSMLLQTEDVRGFIKAARRAPEQYGRHGLRAFVAAHHLNCVTGFTTMRPTSAPDWSAYNEALDRFDLRARLKQRLVRLGARKKSDKS